MRCFRQILVFVGMFALLHCAPLEPNPNGYQLRIRVLDEQGQPIAGAGVDLDGQLSRTNRAGEVEFHDLLGPAQVLIGAPGYLSEPLALDRHDASGAGGGAVEVQLFSAAGPAKVPRWVMHAGGDAMLGRRYVNPQEGLPLLPAHQIGPAARAIVSDLAPLFRAADLRVLNLEAVVGDLPDSAIYPGKRFILLTPPAALAAFDELSVDLVTLGNNHIRDYLDLGVSHTLAALDARGLAHVGASAGPEAPLNPVILEPRPGIRVATFSYTTVDGDFVNSSYAGPNTPAPPECAQPEAPASCFMYEARSWGCERASVAIAWAPRRARPAWELYTAAEPAMSPADQASCWSSLVAVYPELQDWLARRGHGGAAGWDNDNSRAAIAAAAAQAEVVTVQLHAGFQFQTAASGNVKALARDCIDAGADIVIIHHPHVLQGLEWYAGKLIAYSLGNLIFEQEFTSTLTSGFLRTVWEGSTLLEARLIPVELVGYRPIPVTGAAATRTAKLIGERSGTAAVAERDAKGDVRRFVATTPAPDTIPAQVRVRHNSVVLGEVAAPVEAVEVELAAGSEIAAIGFEGLIQAQAGGAELLLGRELFGWGHLEDVLADDEVAPAAQWFIPSGGRYDPVLRLDDGAGAGLAWLELYRHAGLSGDTFARPRGRLDVPEHRFYHEQDEQDDQDGIAIPADGEGSYSVRLRGRLRGAGQPFIRVELFEFDDTNPTEDPTTFAIGAPFDLPLTLPNDDQWQIVNVDLDPAALLAEGRRANVVLIRVGLAPPAAGESVFAVDDLEFIEWRAAAQMQDHFGDYAYVRSPAGGPRRFTLQGMGLRGD